MIDHMAMKHVKNYYVRIAIVIIWNILGMALMWVALLLNNPNYWIVSLLAGTMFFAGLLALMYKAHVPQEVTRGE